MAARHERLQDKADQQQQQADHTQAQADQQQQQADHTQAQADQQQHEAEHAEREVEAAVATANDPAARFVVGDNGTITQIVE